MLLGVAQAEAKGSDPTRENPWICKVGFLTAQLHYNEQGYADVVRNEQCSIGVVVYCTVKIAPRLLKWMTLSF